MNSEYYGVKKHALMENAGRAVYEEIAKRFDFEKETFSFFCGLGNNGGDGFVAARYLIEQNANCRVFLIGKKSEIRTREAKQALKELEKFTKVIEINNAKELIDKKALLCTVIVDAILGTGVKGSIREPLKSIISAINLSKAKKISIDVASGKGSENNIFIDADLVIALHKPKIEAMGFKTVVKDIGIPEKAELFAGPGELVVNLKRKENSKKGDNGRVLIIGGSLDYYGAPIFSALGALASGADLVYLLVPEINFDITRAFSPAFIVKKYDGDCLNKAALSIAEKLVKKADAICIGIGLGLRKESKETLNEILKIASKYEKKVIIDGDGIKLCDRKMLLKINATLTPHEKEFEILTGKKPVASIEKRKEVVSEQALKLSSTILLKGSVDVIASPDNEGKAKVKLNETGNAGLTKGGTGDLLAGLISGFVAQSFSSFHACCSAAFILGYAADMLYKIKQYSYSVYDLAEHIPFAIRRLIELYA